MGLSDFGGPLLDLWRLNQPLGNDFEEPIEPILGMTFGEPFGPTSMAFKPLGNHFRETYLSDFGGPFLDLWHLNQPLGCAFKPGLWT